MHTILHARVTRSVEELTGKSGKVFWKLGMVTQSVDKKNPDGSPYYHWVNGYIFNEKWIKVTPYLKKGVNCFVCGQLKINPYINREGQAAVEIGIFIDRIELMSLSNNFEEKKSVEQAPKSSSSAKEYKEYDEAPSVHKLYPMENKINEEATTADPFFQLGAKPYASNDDIYYGSTTSERSSREESSSEQDHQEYLFDDVPF